MLAGFVDELEKIGSSHGRMQIPKERKGRRSMTVSTLLKKEKDGTLYKAGDAAGNPQPVRGGSSDEMGAATLPKRPGDVPTRGQMILSREKMGSTPYPDVTPFPMGETPPPAPRSPKKKGDVPTLDDLNAVDRYDGRGEATTITGLAQRASDVGISNGEHS